MTAKKTAKKNNANAFKKALENPKVWKILYRVGLFAFLFIWAFNFSSSSFFNENPIFGVKFLAEFLLGLAAGLFGFHTVPIIFDKIKIWFEKFIAAVVNRIVADFWAQQTKRMQGSRRVKQKKQKKEKLKKAREKKNKAKFKSSILLDTSILIDGRITDLVKTGFLDEDFVVPQGVIDELHLVSDSDGSLKRKKGRRGLDQLNKLKKATKLRIFKAHGDVSGVDGVDKELVRLGKKYKMKIMTLDFNLNKVAKAANIEVLNLNELVNVLKPSVLPGEKMKIKVVQEGKEKKQGVGYFEDGTMVVIENAKDKVGKTLTVTVSRVIQTDAGKMIFTEV